MLQVYGICFCPVSKNSDLKALGVDDSKALTEDQRCLLKTSVAYLEWFIPDPALNFLSSGSRQKFPIHADPDPTHIIEVYLEIIKKTP